MKELLENMVMHLANHKEDVQITEERNDGVVDFTLKVNPDDMGRVIGKQGYIANSMRQILKACAIKENVKVNLEISSLDE